MYTVEDIVIGQCGDVKYVYCLHHIITIVMRFTHSMRVTVGEHCTSSAERRFLAMFDSLQETLKCNTPRSHALHDNHAADLFIFANRSPRLILLPDAARVACAV